MREPATDPGQPSGTAPASSGFALAVGAAVILMALMASLFPGRDGLRRWLEDQLAQVDQLRQLRG